MAMPIESCSLAKRCSHHELHDHKDDPNHFLSLDHGPLQFPTPAIKDRSSRGVECVAITSRGGGSPVQ